MEPTERLVRTWMASKRDEEVAQTVLEVSSGRTTLLDVIKALGEYLTSEEDDLRTKGVEFLSLVLEKCPVEIMKRKSVHVLVVFYCSKLEDTETIVPALRGLVHLTSLPTNTSEDVPTITESLFAHVKMKALVQSVRFLVFSIFDNLMTRHREVLKSMDKEFLTGYLALADGEKDPRNLLVAFAIARVILIEFNTADYVEALFNVTFCYFPITFRPPPNDPYGITTEDLRLTLRSCLNATPAFGPMAIPVFLEKLIAGSPVTKRDTLQTMAACLPVYGSAIARGSARKIWSTLKLEIFQPTDPTTEEEALKTVQVLVNTIYAEQDNPPDADENIEGLAREACEECIKILREPEKSQAKPAIKVLSAFMSTTPSVSRFTLSQAVPHLLKLFINTDEVSNRPSILLLLSDLIAASRDSVAKLPPTDTEEPNVPLMPYKDQVLGIVTTGLKTTSSRRPALACLVGLVSTHHLLSEEEVGFIVHNVNEILEADPDEVDDASETVLKLLSTIALSSPRHIEEQTLPLLFRSLPDEAPPRDAVADRAKYWRVLAALRVLCHQAELFETLVIRLTTKLDLLCAPRSSSSATDIDTEPSAAFAHSILMTISQTLSIKVEEGHTDVAKYLDRLLPRLFNLLIYSALVSDGGYMIATDPRVIRVVGQIITSVVQSVPSQKQETFCAALFSCFLSGSVKGIAEGHQKIPSDVKFLPFDDSASAVQRNLVVLFAAAVVALHKEIPIPVPDLNEFLDRTLTWSLVHADTKLQKEAAWHIIASILNKRVDDASGFPDNMLGKYWSDEISNGSQAVERRQHAIQAWGWVSKALLVRNHALAPQFTDRFFQVFGEEAVSWDAARAVGEIVASDLILTKRNHSVIKILYAQRFVNSILPRIIMGAKDSPNSREQSAYLVALASLIKSTPKTTYAHEMSSIIPLLLRGLALPDNDIRVNVIDTLLTAAEGDSPEKGMVSEHASSLVSTMLKNSSVDEMSSARVRVAALRYLGVLPSIVRYDILHPHKATVIRELAKALDDPKRSVRKEAVDARTHWFKYNG